MKVLVQVRSNPALPAREAVRRHSGQPGALIVRCPVSATAVIELET